MRETKQKAVRPGIRHGDMVKVMAGRSKGKTGKVLSVNPAKNTVTVEHANIIKKHTRVGHSTLPDGTKVRVCRRCKATFEK